MKKIIIVAVTVLMVSVFLTSCGKDVDHDTVLSEIAASNQEKHQKREAFMNSDVYALASKDIEEELTKYCTCKWEYSIEPGSLFNGGVEEYNDYSENDETRIAFFQAATLTVSVEYTEQQDSEQLAKQLAADGFTGVLYPSYSDYTYEFDAATGNAECVMIPGV